MPGGIDEDTINCAACVIIVFAIIYIIWRLYCSRRQHEGLLSGQAPPVSADVKLEGATVTQASSDDASYGEYIKGQALEAAVEENHKTWIGEIPHRTTTASTDVDLSGDRYPVPFVGLRRPMMRSITPDSADVRVMPTEPPESMPMHKPFML